MQQQEWWRFRHLQSSRFHSNNIFCSFCSASSIGIFGVFMEAKGAGYIHRGQGVSVADARRICAELGLDRSNTNRVVAAPPEAKTMPIEVLLDAMLLSKGVTVIGLQAAVKTVLHLDLKEPPGAWRLQV
jgi:hypothetical protein